jgi:hypothetical protein
MDDVIGVLQAAEEKLDELENIYGDPRFIETHLKCLGVRITITLETFSA